MSSGPATRMYDALFDVDGSTDEPEVRDLAAEAIAEIDDAALEAMDAAAEVMEAAVPGGLDFETSPGRLRIAGGRWSIVLGTTEETQLFQQLIRRAIQRRKEAGNG